ncbi:hypothetical protein PT287_07465 [Lactobacillus sp. ESL0679]|uniref:hypothetical protein n=1 Tax=Lactobacillus sp. ESL0679 TaxID=2983209 RepID=UPI0023F6B664|nr:hypothetical protein [Lactobacillus sp. ESL0679]MDF7683338.1 hypothetical protein [Lactobacillus sp. ESL0679]
MSGDLKRITICSDRTSLHYVPQLGDEVQQIVTIENDGYITFVSSTYAGPNQDLKNDFRKNYVIKKAKAKQVIAKILSYFIKQNIKQSNNETGSWQLIYGFEGKELLAGNFSMKFTDISDYVRKQVGVKSYVLFDGRRRTNKITRIEIDYNSSINFKSSQEVLCVEHLILDRRKHSFKIFKSFLGRKEVQSYHDRQIAIIFRKLDLIDLFDDTDNCPNSAVIVDQNYIITVDYTEKPQKIISGRFDKNGLPQDYYKLVKYLNEYVRSSASIDVLSPEKYNYVDPKSAKYMLCTVAYMEKIVGIGSF